MADQARNLRAAADRVLSNSQLNDVVQQSIEASRFPVGGAGHRRVSPMGWLMQRYLGEEVLPGIRPGDFVPGAQQALAVRDVADIRAARTDEMSPLQKGVSYASEGLAGASAVPGVGLLGKAGVGLLGMLAGPLARTAKRDAQKLAETMKAQGESDEAIWKATGETFGQPWWLGHPDRVPRFEIPETGYRYSPETLTKTEAYGRTYGKGPLGAAVRHFDVDEAYPGMMGSIKHVKYPWSGKEMGSYRREKDILSGEDIETITAFEPPPGVRASPESTVLHEMQHAIQTREGMAPGGSSSQFTQNIPEPWMVKAATKARKTAETGNIPFEDIIANPPDELIEALKNPSVRHMVRSPEALQEATTRLYLTPFEAYRRLGGEMDARAVQARMNLTPQERLNRPFWQDYDIPLEQMILR